jgi:hypothetical protein
MLGPTDLPPNYQPRHVDEGSLRTWDIIAFVVICVITLGPLTVTAYQNPYSGKVTASPNLPGAK